MKLDPRKNLFVGLNHTGKSTLIRSLLVTLGATPEGVLSQWDTGAMSLVTFSVDEARYHALHQLRFRALFNDNGELIVATDSGRIWSENFARVTGFNLVFSDKEADAVTADPNCFFLPFYINQDGSWQGAWSTFKGLQRFRAPWNAILEYFAGVRPSEYYAARAEREREQRVADELRKERLLLDRARQRMGKTIPMDGPKVQPELFAAEIEQLTIQITDLNQRQEELRDRAVREEETLKAIRMQIRLAQASLAAYDKDTNYLLSGVESALVCPTCGAEHARSFLDFLEYVEDARVLRELVLRLEGDAVHTTERILDTRSELQALSQQYSAIAVTLDTRRGDLQFGEVVASLGAESAFAAFEEEFARLKADIGERLLRLESLDRRLRQLTNPKRTREITEQFRQYYRNARIALNLPPLDLAKVRITTRPNISGSGGPRSVLAYYAAIWRLCLRSDADFSVPVIIDSPNQQGQDEVNLPRVIRFIAQDLPSEIQMIVGLETDTDYEFDNTLRLTEPYRVLRAEEYEVCNELITPFESVMLLAVNNSDDISLFSDGQKSD